jgi:CheY-like chemotaxis protein
MTRSPSPSDGYVRVRADLRPPAVPTTVPWTVPASWNEVQHDGWQLREVAKVALEMVAGWEVSTAGSGLEAQRIALAEHPDALLLDVMMPGMDGPSTVLALRQDPATRDIPVIFLTAKVGGGGHAQWDHLEVAGVIPKPFDPMTLSAEVARLLGW